MKTTNKMYFLRKMIPFTLVFLFLLLPLKVNAQVAYQNTEFDAMSYMLIETDSGKVLAQHDADRKVYPASTTKLMTALLLMEQKGLDGETTVGTEINSLPNGSSLMNLELGEKVTVEDLLYGLMLCSGNDAACTIASYVSGSVEAFVALMNQRAAELGMTGTHFVNPYGSFLNQDEANSVPENLLGVNHYTTAADMAKLAMEVTKFPEILKAGNTKTYMLSPTNKHEEERKINNSNPLINTPENHPELKQYYYKYATGLKTGTVNNIQLGDVVIPSYGNVVASASRGGLSLIALIFDDESEKETEDKTLRSYQRWILAADLFDFGFENFSWVDIDPYIMPVSLTRPIAADETGSEGVFEIHSQSGTLPGKILMDKAAAQDLASGALKLEEAVEVDDILQSAVQVGDTVGTVKYMLNGAVLFKSDLVAADRIQAEEPAIDQDQQTNNAEFEQKLPEWLVWVLIPAGAVGVLFLIRVINLSRRRHRRRHRNRH